MKVVNIRTSKFKLKGVEPPNTPPPSIHCPELVEYTYLESNQIIAHELRTR